MFEIPALPRQKTLNAWTAQDGRHCIELPAACAFEPSKWQSSSVPCRETSERRLGAIRSWSVRIDGHPLQGRVEGFYEPGQFGLLIFRTKLETDHFVRMSFEEDMVHVSFMLERNLYRIEELGDGTQAAVDPADPCCFLLRFARGQEIVWKSRATSGATKIEMFLPSSSFERHYDVAMSEFPTALRGLATGERPLEFQSIPMTPDILDCLDQMISWHRTSPIRGPFLRGKFHNLMSAIWFAAEQLEPDVARRAEVTSRDRKLVTKACLYISENLGSCLTIHTIARTVGTNRNKLNQMFQALLGETVFEHVQRARLERARSLLVDGSVRSITEVAQQVGYADSTSFARAYHHSFGRVPSRDVKRS